MVLVLVFSLVSGMGVGALAEYEEELGELETVEDIGEGENDVLPGETTDVGELEETEEEETLPEDMTALDDGMTAMTSTFSGGSGTADDPYLISSLDDMEALHNDCAARALHPGEYFLMTEDIMLPSDFIPIGSSSSGTGGYNYGFKGIFDGGGHTLTLDGWTQSYTYVAPFSYIQSSAAIRNLTVEGSITTSGGANGTGGIVGYSYGTGTRIENCVSNVTITSTKAASTSNYIGGIVGQTSGVVTNCVNNGNVTAVGGYVAGIAGKATKAVTYCLNTGNITVTGSGSTAVRVAGIAGQNPKDYFYGCANTGLISSDNSFASGKFGTIAATWGDEYLPGCFTTKAVSVPAGTTVSGETLIDAFTAETVWSMNAASGENALVWALSSDGVPELASAGSGAVCRVTYKCDDGEHYVYAAAGSTAAAPAGKEESDFGAFVPGKTIVTGDVTAIEAKSVTLTFYMEKGGEVYLTTTATYGGAFTPPEMPTKEYCSFAGWAREDGTLINEGDTLNVTALYATWTPTYDKDSNTYTLATADALIWYRDHVNAGDYTANAVLAADIDISAETAWTPIGGTSVAKGFAGTFDGAGHSIKLGIDGGSEKALFAYIAKDGVVKNVVTTGTVKGVQRLAGIASYNYGTISGCVNKADITASGSVYFTGGIVAYLYGGVIVDCGNEGDVTGKCTSNGGPAAGGIVGSANYSTSGVTGGASTISNCYNWGAVSSTAMGTSTGYNAQAGGIVGNIYASSTGSPVTIKNSYNAGILSAKDGYAQYVGGIAGYSSVSTSSKDAVIDHCYWEDASQPCLNRNNESYGAVIESCNAYTSLTTLLADLNSYAEDNSLTTWVADTGYDGKPAFRVSVVPQRTITFTGDYTGTRTIANGSRVTLPECEVAGHYYTFDIGGAAFDGSARLYSDTTVNVTMHIYTYTVTYDAGTGSGTVPEKATYDWGTTVTVSFTPAPEKAGYTFYGWTDSTDENAVYTESGDKTFVIKEDRVLTAKYQGYPFGGTGTASDPYQVDSPAALKALAGLVNQNDADYMTAYYIQTKDIDMTGETWTPAGSIGSGFTNGSIYFAGSYDGNGKTIANLTYDGTAKGSGVFAGLNGATVKNLTVTGSITTSGQYVGGLAGYVYGASVIDGCIIKVDVTTTYGSGQAGGIAAYLTDDAVIRNSGHEGSVNGASYVGGIASQTGSYAQIVNSYHGTGTVKGTGAYIGGIVGSIGSSNNKITNSYSAAAEVSTTSTSTTAGAGGIIGSVGSYKPTLESCFYNGDGAAKVVGYQPSYNSGVFEAETITAPGALASKLNNWVTSNEGYKTWAVDADENGGYPIFGTPNANEFYITYNLNGADGTIADTTAYAKGTNAEVKGIGDITYKWHTFTGWATTPDGAAEYHEGDTIEMNADVTLYAVWADFTYWEKTGENAYSIKDKDGLLELVDKMSGNAYVSADENPGFKGYTFTLTADLDMTGEAEFDAIGYFANYNDYSAFNGTLDGAGHTVKFALSGTTKGLVGYLGADGIVKNVKTEGTIAAENLTTGDIKDNAACGGVVGYSRGTVTGCSSAVVITGSATSVGGIVGYAKAGAITGCFYTGTGITGAANVGGIAGTSGATVTNCAVKSGTISATGTNYKATAGGIIGSSSGAVYNNYNLADVSGYYAGGIAGSSGAAIFNNYSAGTLTGTSSYYDGYGVVASYSSGTVNNNYWLDGTAEAASSSTSVIRCSSFTADGKLTSAPMLINAPNGNSSTSVPDTLLGVLNAWVTVYADESMSAWQAGPQYPIFAAETLEYVTITYIYSDGTASTTETIIKGADAELPTAPDGYKYTFTVGGAEWNGKAVTENVTVNVTVEALGTVTITYVYEDGSESTTDTITKGADAVLPTAPDGYEYTFTVGGKTWTGKNVTTDVTVTVTKTRIGLYGSGTLDDPYLITSEKDLLYINGRIMADDEAYVSAVYRVENDITCTESFQGIGVYHFQAATCHPFSGTIYGNDKTITVSITQDTLLSSMPGGGFINYAAGAYICDLTIAGTVNGVSSGATGGIVGYTSGDTTIENCVCAAAVNGGQMVGGIVGGVVFNLNGTTTITGCSLEGDNAKVTATNGAGGVGGILGADGVSQVSVNKATITRCAVKADVVSSGTGASVGGVVGLLNGSVSESYFDGFSTITNAGTKTGGVVGTLNASGSISDCYNTGTVNSSNATTSSYVAGIVAYRTSNGGTVTNCYTTATLKSSGGTLGGIACSGTVENCYYDESYDDDGIVSGIGTPKNVDDMEKQAFVDLLGDKFAVDEEGDNFFWPVLKWTLPQPESYTVKFIGDYTGSVTVEAGGDAELPPNPENGYYTFTVNGAAWDGKNITSNVTVTVTLVKYTYTVTFVGDYTGTETVAHGENAVLPPCNVEGKTYRFTVDGVEWNGANITADVTVTVTMVTPAIKDYDVWDGKTATKWTSGKGSEANPYLIESAANLAYLKEQVAASNSYSGTYFKVTKDLDMTAGNWTGIGNGYANYGYGNDFFQGTLDGDGHSIKLSAYSADGELGYNVGLFNTLHPNGVARNIVIEGSISGAYRAAAIAGCSYGTIENCVNRAEISAYEFAGGIVGQSYYGTTVSCGNEGSVTSTQYAGGIVGDSYNFKPSVSRVLNCYNWGSIKGASASGGIIGIEAASGANTVISNCYSAGTLTGVKNGIVGAFNSSTSDYLSKANMTSCWWLEGTASEAAPNSSTGAKSFTAAEYGKLLESLNANRGDYAEWFADKANGDKPAHREVFGVSHVLTFVADGVKIDAVMFSEGDTSVKEPAVPAKEGYVGMWEDYTLGTADLTVNAVYRLIGDVNNDGRVNAIDAMLTLRAGTALISFDKLQGLAADVNGDGAVNSTDAVLILRYAIGMIDSFKAN